MTWPKHYTLKKDHDKHFEIHDSRDKKSFKVSKKDIHPAHQIKIMKMQKFAEGGEAEESSSWGRMDEQEARGGQESKDLWNNMFGESPDVQERAQEREARDEETKGIFGVGTESPTSTGATGSWDEAPALGGAPIEQAQQLGVQAPEQAQESMVDAAVPNVPQQIPGSGVQAGAPTMGGINKMEQDYTRAANAAAQGEMNQNQQVAKAYDAHLKKQEELAAKFQETMGHYQKQLDTLTQQVAEGKVDPQRYWNSKTEGQKARVWAGAILGGLGGGLNKTGKNMGIEAFHRAVDKDIESQKIDLGKKQSLLSDNLRAQGSLIQAEQATRLQMNAALQGQVAKIAAQTNDPMVKFRYQQLQTQMLRADIPLKAQLAQAEVRKQEMLRAVNAGDPASLVPMMVPEKHQAKAFGEIEAAENTKHMAGNIMEAFEQAVKENTVLKTGAGFLRTPGSVLALHQHMQPTFKDLEGTVRQAAMENTFKNITPSPGDSEHTVATKRNALEQYLQSKMSAPTARAYGIDLNKFGSTAADTVSPQIQTRNGVQYKKVKGGWQKTK